MKILSFDTNYNFKIKRDSKQNNLYNLFQKNVIFSATIPLYIYVVPREYEMRLDKISNYLYGTPNYVEELMILNNIISPYSIKEGQELYFCKLENISSLYTTDRTLEQEIKEEIIQQSSIKDLSTNSTSNLQQIKVDENNRIQIINSFI